MKWALAIPPRESYAKNIMGRRLVSFDWAMKRLLRSKANFGILEGFLSELLRQDIRIECVLESEGNKEDASDKFNRVDLLVRDAKGDLIIVEVQYEREADYLLKILYGVSKAVTEYLSEGDKYSKVKKVISVSLVYFDLGQGEDYVYRGATRFMGIHKDDELLLDTRQRAMFSKEKAGDLYPEYYILKIGRFDDNAKDRLDEWIYFFKNQDIKPSFTARGLDEVKTKLDLLSMSEEERRAYDRFVDNRRYKEGVVIGSFEDGFEQGLEQGQADGFEKGQAEEHARIRVHLKTRGLNDSEIDAMLN